MKLYKHIDSDIDKIQSRLSNYFPHLDSFQLGFTEINLIELLSSVPCLSEWFEELKCPPTHCYLIRTPHGSDSSNAHVDNWHESPINKHENTGFVLGINFPISNVEGTMTDFYEYIDGPVKNLDFGSYDVIYRFYGKANLKKIGSYTLDRAVIINTSIPHSVINFTNKDRYALTFRFKNDPWHLFYD